ncbi:hypothetical protein, partial [Azospirillum isscasi]
MTIHSSAGRPVGAAFGIAPPSAGDSPAARCGASWEAGREAGREAGPGCLVAGDPAGRRVVLIHAASGEARAWTRL